MLMYCTVRIEKGAFHMIKPRLRLVTPATVKRTVSLRRPRNGEVRTREHLTEDEVEKLIEAAKNNRHGHRDALMVLMTYRHGLRAAEVVDLRWEQGPCQPLAFQQIGLERPPCFKSGSPRQRGTSDSIENNSTKGSDADH
jgi:integrase